MTDFDYEVFQRKRLAQQARYVKRGSKSKKCNLPCDGMTNAQWKKRNGEVLNMNLNRPMGWAEFKRMPTDLQQEYINKLQGKFYGLNACSLAQMFGVTDQCVRSYLKERFDMQGTRGKTMDNITRDLWLDFITAPESPEPEIDPPAEVLKPEPEEVSDPTHIDNFIVEFSGIISPESIYNTLRSMLKGRADGTVTIECKFA